MNRGDVVKIIKKVPLFNGVSWSAAFRDDLIDSELLYAIYLKSATTAPVLAYNGGTYYAPSESFEFQENLFCLIPVVRRGKVFITSFDGLRQLTTGGELVDCSDGGTPITFDSHEEANNYIRDTFQVLTEW